MRTKSIITQAIIDATDAEPDTAANAANSIMEALLDKGLAIVPKEPTKTMLAAANALQCTKAIDSCITIAYIHGAKLPDFAPGQTPLEQWYREMVTVAQQ